MTVLPRSHAAGMLFWASRRSLLQEYARARLCRYRGTTVQRVRRTYAFLFSSVTHDILNASTNHARAGSDLYYSESPQQRIEAEEAHNDAEESAVN